jgi:uncharacterized membrane protein
MRRLFSPLCALALAAAATGAAAQEDETKMVENVTFEASGPPGWRVEIGDDIGVRLGPAFFGSGHGDDFASTVQLFPRTHVRELQGERRWSSTDGRRRITLIATPGACSDVEDAHYTHHVRLIRNWGEPHFRNLSGCGGRPIDRPDSE